MADPQSPLLTLPAEIRSLIYKHALRDAEIRITRRPQAKIDTTEHRYYLDIFPAASLLLVNSTTHRESLSIFWDRVTLKIERCSDDDARTLQPGNKWQRTATLRNLRIVDKCFLADFSDPRDGVTKDPASQPYNLRSEMYRNGGLKQFRVVMPFGSRLSMERIFQAISTLRRHSPGAEWFEVEVDGTRSAQKLEILEDVVEEENLVLVLEPANERVVLEVLEDSAVMVCALKWERYCE